MTFCSPSQIVLLGFLQDSFLLASVISFKLFTFPLYIPLVLLCQNILFFFSSIWLSPPSLFPIHSASPLLLSYKQIPQLASCGALILQITEMTKSFQNVLAASLCSRQCKLPANQYKPEKLLATDTSLAPLGVILACRGNSAKCLRRLQKITWRGKKLQGKRS